MCPAENTPKVPQHNTLPCRDVVLALMRKLPAFLDLSEELPATLAERYSSTNKEVQDKLRENVSVL